MFNLTKEEMEKFAEDFAKEYAKKEENKINFKQSSMDEAMKKLYLYLKENKEIDDEVLSYSPERFPFTSEEYITSFELLEEFAKENELGWIDKENYFPNHHCQVIFEDMVIELRTMHGQGTASQMWVADEKNNQAFTYQSFKENQK